MICTNKAYFRYDTKWQDTYPLKGRKFYVIPVTNHWKHKIPTDSQCNDGYPGSCRNLIRIWKWHNAAHSAICFWFRTFLSITLHMRCALNTQCCLSYCHVIFVKSNCKIRVPPFCFPDIPYIFIIYKNNSATKFRLYKCYDKCVHVGWIMQWNFCFSQNEFWTWNVGICLNWGKFVLFD